MFRADAFAKIKVPDLSSLASDEWKALSLAQAGFFILNEIRKARNAFTFARTCFLIPVLVFQAYHRDSALAAANGVRMPDIKRIDIFAVASL